MEKTYQSKAKPFFPLFARPNAFIQSALVATGIVIEEVLNQSPAQQNDLPYAIKDLSAMLTNERTELVKPYWTSSRFIAAYTSFFMSWNLVRLTQLFPYLEIPECEDEDYIIDLGSGTITTIISLWIARADLREKKLNIIASDVATKPMEIGLSILKKIAEKLEVEFLWNVKLEKKNIGQMIKDLAQKQKIKPKLIISANVFNEVETRQGIQKNELVDFFLNFTQDIKSILLEDGAYLSVEPGTRQGGRIISTLREQAILNELFPYSPCPHPYECPILANPQLKTWCHMQCPTYSPSWLKDLSKSAGMERDNLSLSFVFLKPYYEGSYPNAGRIISNAFPVPGRERCRYLCSDQGLLLLPRSAQLPHSSLVSIVITNKRDKKTGANIAQLISNSPYEDEYSYNNSNSYDNYNSYKKNNY